MLIFCISSWSASSIASSDPRGGEGLKQKEVGGENIQEMLYRVKKGVRPQPYTEIERLIYDNYQLKILIHQKQFNYPRSSAVKIEPAIPTANVYYYTTNATKQDIKNQQKDPT